MEAPDTKQKVSSPWMLKKHDQMVWTTLMFLRSGTSIEARSCEYGDEPSVSIMQEMFLIH
jgi:hypothetical protein